MVELNLEDTNSDGILAAMVRARNASGSPALDMVLTLLVVTDEDTVADALEAAVGLSQEHPARILGVIRGPAEGEPRLDARIRVAHDESPESIVMRMSGPLVDHAESAVLPLMLPDSPVVVWWAGTPPVNPAADPLGALGQRRLTDTETTAAPVRTLKTLGRHYSPGDTDLSWTRATPWRALLAAALDQVATPVDAAEIEAGDDNPVAVLLQSWLGLRLKLPVQFTHREGPRIHSVTLHTAAGIVSLKRVDAHSCEFSVPGSVSRHVPLGTRSITELLAEDLRRLDPDDMYAATLRHLLRPRSRGA